MKPDINKIAFVATKANQEIRLLNSRHVLYLRKMRHHVRIIYIQTRMFYKNRKDNFTWV